jgi:hypothetical protein
VNRRISPSPGFLIVLAALVALGHALAALTATAAKSMTADEIAHLTAGHVYNTRGDFRFQPENGNLPQRWAALPLTLAGTPLPPEPAAWQRADVWRFGHALFFGQGVSADALLWAGRGMVTLFSAALGLLIFLWSRALFGWRGGFLSLALYVFCPAFLAHGALATSDVVMTFFFVAAVGAWWRHLEQPGTVWARVSAITFALACLAKFSSVLLLPMFALCAGVWLFDRARREGWRGPLARLARSALLHVAVAWAAIWIFHHARYAAFAPEHAAGAGFYRGDWEWILSDIGVTRGLFELARDLHLLPESYLYGFAFVLQFARERAAFLSGEYSYTGWVSFFPFTFLVKTTLPFLLLVAGGAIAAVVTALRIRTHEGPADLVRRLRPLVPLAALFVIYWLTSLASHLNIGHRHLLPTYPVLFIAAGWLGRWLDLRRPVAALAIAGLVVWHVAASVQIRPHYLAYFNPLVGGPANGWRHLVDSSLDWGQDLPGLKAWLDTHAKREPVFLSYFGTGDPAYEGIRATMLPSLPEVGAPRRWHALTPGIYAIGATPLQHVYSSIRGPWTVEREQEFQKLRAIEADLLAYQDDPARRAAMVRDAPAENWTTAWKRYETLRFARLCHYLRARPADADIGYSIRIYRLSADELRGAVGGTAAEWQAQIERAVRP